MFLVGVRIWDGVTLRAGALGCCPREGTEMRGKDEPMSLDDDKKPKGSIGLVAGSIVVAVLMLVVISSTIGGKGKQPEVEPSAPVQKVEPAPVAKPVVRPPLTFTPKDGTFLEDYRSNPVGADIKWKGKRGVMTFAVGEIGKSKEGVIWVSNEGILGQTHNVYYFMAPGQEEAVAKLKRDEVIDVEATCDGYVKDGIYRGIVGYEFRVNFSDCVVRPKKK